MRGWELATVAVAALLCLPAPAPAQGHLPRGSASGVPTAKHEPVFGIGPQTIWQGGIGAGVDFHVSRRVSADGERTAEERELHAHVDYGVTEDLTLRISMPLVKNKTETTLHPGAPTSSSATGVGDLMVRAKYRFWHRFSGSTQYHASVIGRAELPSGNSTSEPQLSPAGTDYLAGATISRDGLRYYLWASGIARMNGGAFGGSRTNEFRYDAAFGWRPWVPSFTGVDPLLLLEFNGVTMTEGGAHGEPRPAGALLGNVPPAADVGAGGARGRRRAGRGRAGRRRRGGGLRRVSLRLIRSRARGPSSGSPSATHRRDLIGQSGEAPWPGST